MPSASPDKVSVVEELLPTSAPELFVTFIACHLYPDVSTMLTVLDAIAPDSVPDPEDELPYIATEIVVEPPAEFVTVAEVVPLPELFTVVLVLY